MALQGSLETVGLPDVLSLFGRAAKTGRLDITGSRRSGGIWFRDGHITAISTGSTPEPTEPVEALFELLRIGSGTFSFDDAAPPPERPTPLDLSDTLAAAQARLAEWRTIEAVVGSLDATVELVGDAIGPITVSPEQWEMVLAIHGPSPIREVLQRRGLGEFAGCNTIKTLVDAGFARIAIPTEAPLPVVTLAEPDLSLLFTQPGVGISDPPGLEDPFAASGPALWPTIPALPDPSEPVEFDLDADNDTAASIPGEAEEDGDGPTANAGPQPEESMNRGLLLKFLSSVRP